MRIRSHGVRALALTAAAGLLLGGVAITSASAAPTVGLGQDLPADIPPGLPASIEPELPETGVEDKLPDTGVEDKLPDTGVEEKLPATGVDDASAPEPCSEPPNVDVDQSDPAYSTISISFSCEAEAELHRIITATVGGTEILKIDTRTMASGTVEHATEVTIPKAVVCITDGSSGEETCLPS